ncbi:cell cycle checkpoint control protein rad9a [Chytriomyces hyalinus]|nr:cell cycle checkpoint control protein rad9a [Chytriomyces hyalinus]
MRIEFGHAVAKGFARCIATLSRIGDDVFIEVLPNGVMLLYTVNLARTAFAKVALLASFFDHYETGSQSPRHFKVLLKTMTTIFKSKAAYIDLIEKVRFRIQEAPTDRLVVELHCKHGVKKIFQLHYQTTDPQKAAFSKSACTSMFSASPKIIQDWLGFFSYKLDELSIGCTLVDDDGTGDLGGRKVVIRSFSDDIMGATQVSQPEADPTKRSLATEISVDYEDFDTFDVFSDVEITFSLKDLKTALSFADNIGQCINAHFIGPGQPIILSTSQENIYSADFVLATNSVGSSTQASTSVKTSASGTVSSNRAGTAKSISSTNSTQTAKNPPRVSTPFQTSRKQSQSQTQTPQSAFKPFLGSSNTTRKTNHGAMDEDTDDETPLFSQAASQPEQQRKQTPEQQPPSSAHQRLSEIKKRRRESQIAATQSPLSSISKRDLLFDESARSRNSHSNAARLINVPPTSSHESRPSGRRSSKGSHVSGTMRSGLFDQEEEEEEDEVPLQRPTRGANQSVAITQKLSPGQQESLFGSAEKASSFSSFMMDSGGDSKKLQVAFSVGLESTVAPENNDAFFDQQDDDMTVDDWNYVIRASQEAEDEETLKQQRRQRLESHVNEEGAEEEEEEEEDDDDEVIPPSPEGGFVDLEASRLIVPNYRLSGSDFQRVGGQGSGNRGASGTGGSGKSDLVQKVGLESFMHSYGGSVGQSGDGEFDPANEPPRLGNSGIMRPVSDYASRFQFSQSQASQSRIQRADEGSTEFDYEGGADPTPAKSPHVSRQYQGRPKSFFCFWKLLVHLSQETPTAPTLNPANPGVRQSRVASAVSHPMSDSTTPLDPHSRDFSAMALPSPRLTRTGADSDQMQLATLLAAATNSLKRASTSAGSQAHKRVNSSQDSLFGNPATQDDAFDRNAQSVSMSMPMTTNQALTPPWQQQNINPLTQRTQQHAQQSQNPDNTFTNLGYPSSTANGAFPMFGNIYHMPGHHQTHQQPEQQATTNHFLLNPTPSLPSMLPSHESSARRTDYQQQASEKLNHLLESPRDPPNASQQDAQSRSLVVPNDYRSFVQQHQQQLQQQQQQQQQQERVSEFTIPTHTTHAFSDYHTAPAGYLNAGMYQHNASETEKGVHLLTPTVASSSASATPGTTSATTTVASISAIARGPDPPLNAPKKTRGKNAAATTTRKQAATDPEAAKRPRTRNKWTTDEILALAEGMQVYGTNWAGLLNDPRFAQPLVNRSQMQCKDKAAVEKEKRVKEAMKEGRVVTVEELGVWRYACDRKRTFGKGGGGGGGGAPGSASIAVGSEHGGVSPVEWISVGVGISGGAGGMLQLNPGEDAGFDIGGGAVDGHAG